MATVSARPRSSPSRATDPLLSILREISVPQAVLDEARRRRDLVLTIACEHDIARARFSSGSVAYGVTNSPLEDADGGIKVNRRLAIGREFGPDAVGGHRPEALMEAFADFIVQRLRRRGYPSATVNTSGNRALKFEFHEPVDFDELQAVDPYVDFIIGVARQDGGLWIPNKRLALGWDVADPAHHLYVMNRRDSKELRVHRAHVIRLSKRTVKRDKTRGRTPVVCPWNLCALALEIVDDVTVPLPEALAHFLTAAAIDIRARTTPDPSPVVEPIGLPEGISRHAAADRLSEMAQFAWQAATAPTEAAARNAYGNLYGPELAAIRDREAAATNKRLAQGLPAIAAAAASNKHKRTSSDGGA